MKILSAKFLKGVIGDNEILSDGTPQVALIGRSNVGKSSIINTLTNQKDLARTSSFPGRTQEINIFLINGELYLVDLPGYGFAKMSQQRREKLQKMNNWYLFGSPCLDTKILLIIDAEVGPTEADMELLCALEDHNKKMVIVANKVDKIKKATYKNQMQRIIDKIGSHKIIPFSVKKRIGVGELSREILTK